MSICQYSPGLVHACNVRIQTALRSRTSAAASDTMHDVHVPLGDVEDPPLPLAANDLPLHERGPKGHADDRDVLDLLAVRLVLPLRPLLPGRRLLYCLVVFIYTTSSTRPLATMRL